MEEESNAEKKNLDTIKKETAISLQKAIIREKTYSALLVRKKIEAEEKKILHDHITTLKNLMVELMVDDYRQPEGSMYCSLLSKEEKVIVKKMIMALLKKLDKP